MVKFVVKQQNPDLEEDDINKMMTRVLIKESSGVGLHSSASTHDPHYEQVYIIENCLFGFEKCFQVTHEIGRRTASTSRCKLVLDFQISKD